MDRFHLMSVFVAVAEEQGFAAAARRLRMSPPAVTRAISALEQRLGVKLLNRTTRYVRTTDAGQRYLEDARRIMAEVDMADDTAAGINAEPRGHLTVTAPALFGRIFVIPGIVEYQQQYPDTQVSAVFLDRIVNMFEEGIDVGLRIGELPDSSMRALRVGSVRRILCATPDYLQQHGEPETLEQLAQHTLITSSAGNSPPDWNFTYKKENKLLRIQPRLRVTTNDAALEATLQNFGITRLLSYQAAAKIAEGKLKIIMETFEPSPWPVHIIHREGRNASAKIRTFVDLLARRLRSDSALQIQ
ncbi:LysR family transcriptional regulator [Amphritea sp. HPY]|uniref:LysR family transcriptional regulator n=1 Tax=Amphritea sp. HPY TaxID=3421652 RepID=UPI003D7D7730